MYIAQVLCDDLDSKYPFGDEQRLRRRTRSGLTLLVDNLTGATVNIIMAHTIPLAVAFVEEYPGRRHYEVHLLCSSTRSRGGTFVLTSLQRAAQDKGWTIKLHAVSNAVEFYHKLGFSSTQHDDDRELVWNPPGPLFKVMPMSRACMLWLRPRRANRPQKKGQLHNRTKLKKNRERVKRMSVMPLGPLAIAYHIEKDGTSGRVEVFHRPF